eukprot:7816218-Pyramimonas_sp.AAC.1
MPVRTHPARPRPFPKPTASGKREPLERWINSRQRPRHAARSTLGYGRAAVSQHCYGPTPTSFPHSPHAHFAHPPFHRHRNFARSSWSITVSTPSTCGRSCARSC